MKIRVLFVDDEPRVLWGLERMLRTMRHEWEMAFAQSGRQALNILNNDPFDVVVSDIRMPGIDGPELLAEVMERHPRAVRIVLSGQSSPKVSLSTQSPQAAQREDQMPSSTRIVKAEVFTPG